MAINIRIDFAFPKKATEKAMKLLSEKLASSDTITRVNPRKILELTEEGDLTMELIEGLGVACHRSGCFHFNCENFDEQKLNLIAKAFATLSQVYDIGKESKEAEIYLFVSEDKIPRKRLRTTIRKGIKPNFEEQIKNLYQEDVKVVGIRFVSPPNVSDIIDITGVSVRMGPTKMLLDRFKDEATIIELVKKSIGRLKKTLEVT